MKLWLVPTVSRAKVRGYTPVQRRRIIRITEEHRLEWLAAWNSFFGA